MATAINPRDIPTSLIFLNRIGTEPPFHDISEGRDERNFSDDVHVAVIHDARGREKELGLSLDTSGFQFVKHESAEKAFTNEAVIKDVYYKEVVELLKSVAGAKRVFIFDHTVRRKSGYKPVEGEGPVREPVEGVHVDQSFEAGVARVHRHLGEEAERLLKGRVRIINVWRPIGNPVAHKPLAVCDWRSLDAERDLVSVRMTYPGLRVGGVFGLQYNPNLRWYYLSDQTPEEVTLIKCYDSETDCARCTPHSAFIDNASPKDAPQRESIEVRCLVFDTE